MSGISDFTGADRWIVETALRQHYGHIVTVEPADSEIRQIRLYSAAPEITVYPTYYWEQDGVEFVIFKVAEDRYRSRFMYSASEQFSTGDDFDNLAECVSITLRLQDKHAKEDETKSQTAGCSGAELH
jgi:hypothetical protein